MSNILLLMQYKEPLWKEAKKVMEIENVYYLCTYYLSSITYARRSVFATSS